MAKALKGKNSKKKGKKSFKPRSFTSKTTPNDAETVNPFELKVNRQKFNILGRKVGKHEVGRPIESRAKALKRRKETVLVEYKNRGKVNKIVDRRIGEFDKSLTDEQKKLKRLAKLRKATRFNLADSDEEQLGPEEKLTHFGQSLADGYMDFSDDSDDDGKLAGDIVASQHFSGGGLLKQKTIDSETKAKSHYERMQELLAKKDERKHERDRQKEEMKNQREELDKGMKDLWTQIRAHMQGAPEKREQEEQLRNKTSSLKMAFNTLKQEYRVEAAQRLKTPQELAKEKKERLERLEAERLRRMHGNMVEKETVSTDALTTLSGKPLERPKRGKKRAHDDDSDNEDDDEKRRKTSDDELEDGDDDGDEEGSSDDENEDEEESGEEGSNDEDEADEDSEEEDDYDDLKSDDGEDVSEKDDASAESGEEVGAESGDEDGAESGDDDEAADKNEAKAASSEAADKFEEKLLHYKETLSGETLPSPDVLGEMTRELLEMGVKNPFAAGQVITQVITVLNELPLTIDVLLLLRLFGSIFPTSDLRHPITTPTMLLMSKFLTRIAVKNCQDIASGLFLSTLFLEYVSLSKRFVPEAINFLSGVLYLAANRPPKTAHLVVSNFRLGDRSSTANPMNIVSLNSDATVSTPLNLLRIFSDKEYAESDELRLNCLALCLNLAKRFRTLYSSMPAVEAVFAPIKLFCESLDISKHPNTIKALHESLLATLREKITYRPLVRMAKKPKPAKQLEPLFNERFSERKKLAGPRDQVKNVIEKRKKKKQMKDKARELRKDERVIQAHVLSEIRKKNEKMEQATKRIMTRAAQEYGELKAAMKGSKKKTEKTEN